jgi:hypothetical protein
VNRRLLLVGTVSALALGGAVVPGPAGSTARAADACVAPSGLSPNDGPGSSAPARKDLVLSWLPVSGAGSYDVQVSPNEDFTNNVTQQATTAGTRYAVPTASIPEISYFWRVRVSGTRCWSDDGATPAAAFTKSWDVAPAPLTPAGSVVEDALRFSWRPIRDAAFYEVEVTDASSGQRVGRCFTDSTQLTLANIAQGRERLPQATDCLTPSDLDLAVSYRWRVRAFDQTAVSVDGTPYPLATTDPFTSPPRDVPTGPVQVTRVSPRFGPTVGGTRLDVDGVGFVNGSTSVSVGGGSVAASDVVVDSATHLHVVLPASAAGPTNVIVTVSGKASSVTPRSRFTYVDSSEGLFTESFDRAEISLWSPRTDFILTPRTTAPGTLLPPTGLTAIAADPAGNPTTDCTTGCASTPTLSWSAVPDATEYRIYLWADVNATRLIRAYETHGTSLTPRDLLLDNQAGRSYQVQVQSCSDTACGQVSTVLSFRKRSAPVGGVTLPAQGASTSDRSITLAWSDYLSTNGSAQEAAQYLLQVSTTCDFGANIDSAQVDQPEYTSLTATYPDGTYYWRVAALDNSGSPLTWGPAPNRDTTASSGTCGDTRRFTVNRSGGATTTGAGFNPKAEPLTIHYGSPVLGLTVANVALIEASTQRVVPSTVTLLPDGASVLPRLSDLVSGEIYVVRVLATITDSAGNVVQPISTGFYRAPTRTDAPGAFVRLGGSWTSRSARGALNGSALVTSGRHRESLSLQLRGTAVTVGFCTGPTNGWIAVYVDGRLVRTLSTYNPFTRCGKPGTATAPRTTVTRLDGNRQHLLTVVATGQKGRRGGRSATIDWVDVA